MGVAGGLLLHLSDFIEFSLSTPGLLPLPAPLSLEMERMTWLVSDSHRSAFLDAKEVVHREH